MVYIDRANIKYGRMVMCHMLADSIDELHQMAEKIGIKKKWFQNNLRHPHYDICLSKKKLAISFGAVEVDSREVMKMLNSK